MTAAASGLVVTTPSDLEIVMTREFRAPRARVWEAMTQPALIQRWMFCPPGWSWAACESDTRVGGRFRWAWNGPDGRLALTISGENREVTPPSRLVHTELMEMGPGAGSCGPDDCGEPWELLATIDLTEKFGVTQLRMTLLFRSRAARDMALASGMEQGVGVGYDQLDGVLASM